MVDNDAYCARLLSLQSKKHIREWHHWVRRACQEDSDRSGLLTSCDMCKHEWPVLRSEFRDNLNRYVHLHLREHDCLLDAALADKDRESS